MMKLSHNGHSKIEFEDRLDTSTIVVAGALFKAIEFFNKTVKEITRELKRGRYYLPPKKIKSLTTFQTSLITNDAKYLLRVFRMSKERFRVELMSETGGSEKDILWGANAEVKESSENGKLMSFNGRSHVVYGMDTGSGLTITINGRTRLFQKENDPSQIRATIPGKLMRYVAKDGERIEKNGIVAEIEVMKIVIPLLSAEEGVLETCLTEGSIISVGDIVAKLDFDHDKST
ncbi:Acetyl-CoA Carboxylase, partial [Bonamia ostreae]